MTQVISAAASGQRILVVDNDIVIRGVLRALLGKLGRKADDAKDTEEAWQKLMDTTYDLVILDLDMPTQGGMYLCQQLRNHPRYAKVPIVILTAANETAKRGECLASGASLFVTKPFTASVIVRELQPLLDLKQSDLATLATIVAGDRGVPVQDAAVGRRSMMDGSRNSEVLQIVA